MTARGLLAGALAACALLTRGLAESACPSGSCDAVSAPSLLQKASAFSMIDGDLVEDASSAGAGGGSANGLEHERGGFGGESEPYVPDCLEDLDARKFFDRDVSGHLDANAGTQMIRHVFHDSIDFRNIVDRESGEMEASTEGGIDGCLMATVWGKRNEHLDPGHNDGLKVAVLVLNQARAQAHLRNFSRADLSVLGATVAIEKSTNGPHLPMKWGRPDLVFEKCRVMAGLGKQTNCVSPPGCPTGKATHGVKTAPPGRTFKFGKVLEAFQALNYTKKDMVALLGAHSVGMISSCASFARFPQQGESCAVGRATTVGFGGANPLGQETKLFDIGGAWDQTPDCFDGRYFATFSRAHYESLNSCCGQICRLESHYPAPTCQDGASIHDSPQDSWKPQCKLSLRWCRRDQHGVLMKNTKDYAFTSTKLQEPMGPGSNLHPTSQEAPGPKKVPLIRTASEWSLLSDPEARGFMEEFGASERAFFDAFQAAWAKMQTRTSGQLRACRTVRCEHDAGRSAFLCNGRAFRTGSSECTTPPPNASCSLVGNVGSSAVISCGGQERLCCEHGACAGPPRAWRHRQGADVGNCPKAPIVGDSAVESNLQFANVSTKDIIKNQACPVWKTDIDNCKDLKTESACSLLGSCTWDGWRCADQAVVDPFEDLGKGCCAPWTGYVHNGPLGVPWPGDSLTACKTKCLSWVSGGRGCSFIMHGWTGHGGTWCVILPKGNNCGYIHPTHNSNCWTHMGSRNVHTYKFLNAIWHDKEPEPTGYNVSVGLECADTSDDLLDEPSFGCGDGANVHSQYECARYAKHWCSKRPDCFGVMTHPLWTVRARHVKLCTSARLRPSTGWRTHMRAPGVLVPSPDAPDARWKLTAEGTRAAARPLFDRVEPSLDHCKARCWRTSGCESFAWGGACERLTSEGWTKGHYIGQYSWVRTWQECAGRCAREGKCEYWTKDPNGRCHLMREPRRYWRSKNHVQGFRQQQCGRCRGWGRAQTDVEGTEPPAATRVYQLRAPKPQLWTDQGGGCCSRFARQGNVLFSNWLGTLDQCKEKCLTYSDCGYINYGWSGSSWCDILRKGATCLPLDSGPRDCGSAGDNGVRNYKFDPSPMTALQPELEPETAPEPEPLE